MSLVDKIKDINVGDLVVLHPEGKNELDKSGYVADYSSTTIKLSNTETRDSNGEIRYVSNFFGDSKERVATLPLDWFNSYEILKKYEPKKESTPVGKG